jgi:hypothetical protein
MDWEAPDLNRLNYLENETFIASLKSVIIKLEEESLITNVLISGRGHVLLNFYYQWLCLFISYNQTQPGRNDEHGYLYPTFYVLLRALTNLFKVVGYLKYSNMNIPYSGGSHIVTMTGLIANLTFLIEDWVSDPLNIHRTHLCRMAVNGLGHFFLQKEMSALISNYFLMKEEEISASQILSLLFLIMCHFENQEPSLLEHAKVI